MADGSYGMGGGPLDPKVIGWLWGFGWGAAIASMTVGFLIPMLVKQFH